MSYLRRYRCHKEVMAAKIMAISVDHNGAPPDVTMSLDGGDSPIPVRVAAVWFEKHEPVVGGYYVIYDDGYASFSPAKAFEEGCSLL